MGKLLLVGRWILLLLLFGLVGCGGNSGGSSQRDQQGHPGASPAALLVVAERVLDGPTIVPQVAAYQNGQVRWAFRLPVPGKALAAAGGVVYVGAGETVYALDAQTGHQRWHGSASPQVRAISVIAGQVYVDTGGGFTGAERIVVFSLAGQQRWQYTPPSEQDIPAWVVDGGVFYTAVSGVPASLVARDATNGALRWQAPLQVESPLQALLPAGPDALLVVAQASLVLARRSDGTPVWRRDHTQAVAPQVLGDTVYSFFVDQPTTFGGEPPVFLRALQVQDGSLRWQQPLPSNDAGFLASQQALFVGAMTAQGCYLADGSHFDTVHAWALTDGSQRWIREGGERITGLLADAQMVSLASAQQLIALQSATGQIRWQQANPDNLTRLSEGGGLLLGMNPLTRTLAGYDLTNGQRVFRLQPQALDQYLSVVT